MRIVLMESEKGQQPKCSTGKGVKSVVVYSHNVITLQPLKWMGLSYICQHG